VIDDAAVVLRVEIICRTCPVSYVLFIVAAVSVVVAVPLEILDVTDGKKGWAPEYAKKAPEAALVVSNVHV
jgi:hypothetical protein